MVKFVLLPLHDGGWLPVNPDRVAYLRKRAGAVAVVFDGFAGGVHDVVVAGDAESVLQLLEGPPAAEAPRMAPQAQPLTREPFDDGWSPPTPVTVTAHAETPPAAKPGASRASRKARG